MVKSHISSASLSNSCLQVL